MKNLSICFDETVSETHYYHTDFNEDDLADLKDHLIGLGFDKELVEQVDLQVVNQILNNTEDEKFEVEVEKTHTYKCSDGTEQSYTTKYRLDWEVDDYVKELIYDNGWDDCETNETIDSNFDNTIEEV